MISNFLISTSRKSTRYGSIGRSDNRDDFPTKEIGNGSRAGEDFVSLRFLECIHTMCLLLVVGEEAGVVEESLSSEVWRNVAEAWRRFRLRRSRVEGNLLILLFATHFLGRSSTHGKICNRHNQ